MNKKIIPLSVPNLKGKELEYVTEAVKTEWVSTAGPYITDFEKAIINYVNVEAVAACQSGTSGLHLSLMALGIQGEGKVIVPTLTFIAAVNPVKYLSAKPVFIDYDDTLTLDPIKLQKFCEEECEVHEERLIHKSAHKRMTAIIVVHVFGNLADIVSIMEIAHKYHLKVLEDATGSLGSFYVSGKYAGKYAGTIGDMGVYSFNGNKIITTGSGGMIVSNEKSLVERSRFLSTQAKADKIYFVREEIGYNYRMTNLQAALGLARLERLEEFIKIKKASYDLYQKDGINLLPFRSDIRSNYWFYSHLTENKDGLIQYLNEHNIQSRPIWQLIHTLKPYQNSLEYKVEEALWYYDRVVNIPCSSNLQSKEVDRISELIKKYGEDV